MLYMYKQNKYEQLACTKIQKFKINEYTIFKCYMCNYFEIKHYIKKQHGDKNDPLPKL